MRKLRYCLMMFLTPLLLCSCDEHECPEQSEQVSFTLKLSYNPDLTYWYFLQDDTAVTEQGLGETYDNSRTGGKIRYVIRAYPGAGMPQDAAREFVFTKDVSEGYDHEVTLSLPPGDYSIMVWSDLTESGDLFVYYDADDFAEITLQGDHVGNDDFRDAFRGSGEISLSASVTGQEPETFEIAMERPLAKFEIVSDDLAEFIEKLRTGMAKSGADNVVEAKIDIADYRVVLYYVGFMPDTYSMFTDKPVDSATGVSFQSAIRQTGDSQATLGFDYVFVNGKESAVTVRVGIYDRGGTLLSLTDLMEVSIKRNRHTVLRGKFLMQEASGGVNVNPDYNGDHNLVFP